MDNLDNMKTSWIFFFLEFDFLDFLDFQLNLKANYCSKKVVRHTSFARKNLKDELMLVQSHEIFFPKFQGKYLTINKFFLI